MSLIISLLFCLLIIGDAAAGPNIKESNPAEQQVQSPALAGNDSPPPSNNSADSPAAAQESYDLAMVFMNGKQYEKARDLFIKAIAQYADFAEACAGLGDAYTLLKKEEAAYDSYRKALGIIDKIKNPNPDQIKLRDELTRKTEKIMILENKLYALVNGFIFNLTDLGAECVANDDYILAEEINLMALQVEPDNAEAITALKKIKSALAQDDADKTALSSADAGMQDTYYQAALILIEKSKYDEAITNLNKALGYSRNFSKAWFKLGECYERLKDIPRAIKSYRLCIKHANKQLSATPEDNDLIVNAAKSLDRIDNDSKQLNKMKNDYITGLLLLATDCQNKKLFSLLEKVLRRVTEVDPTNKTAQQLYAQLPNSSAPPPSGKSKEQTGDTDKPKAPDTPTPDKSAIQDLIKSSWTMAGAKPDTQHWRIANGQIEANPRLADSPAYYMWDGEVPERYILTVKFIIDRPKSTSSDHIGIVYGANHECVGVSARDCPNGTISKLELIKDGATQRVLLNGQVIGENLKPKTPAIGLMAKNCFVYFSAVTLQALVNQEPANAPEPAPAGVQDLVKSYWAVEGARPELQHWRVAGGRIEADPKLADNPGFYMWSGPIPAKYTLTIKFTIERPRSSSTDHIGVVYGAKHEYIGVAARDCPTGVANKLELIKDGATHKVLLNGKVIGENLKPKTPAIGLMAENCFVYFSSVTLQE